MTADWQSAVAPATSALAWTLLHSLWQGAIIYLVGVRPLVSRDVDADTRYAAGNAALAILLAMQAATFAACLRWGSRPDWWGPADASLQLTVDGLVVRPPPLFGGWAGSVVDAVDPFLPCLLIVWAGIAIARVVLHARAAAAISRVLAVAPPLPEPLLGRCLALAAALNVSRPVRFVAAAIADAPGTLGWARPYVFVPPALLLSMTPAQLEAFVAHELAHIVRHDYAAAVLQSVVEACYACNPFVAAIVRRLHEDAELCCDRLAVRHVGDPHEYATAIAVLVERTLAGPAIGANGGSLTDRVRAVLLRPSSTRRRTFSRLLASAAVAAVLVAASGASLASVSRRDAEARWLAQRTLGQAIAAILDRRDASLEERAAAAELLAMAADSSARGQTALIRAILTSSTLERVASDAHTRRRLVDAAMFENDRAHELLRRFEAMVASPCDGPTERQFLGDLRRTTWAQSAVADVARSKLDAGALLRLAALSAQLYPEGDLSIWIARLRAAPVAGGGSGAVTLSSPPPRRARPQALPSATRPAGNATGRG